MEWIGEWRMGEWELLGERLDGNNGVSGKFRARFGSNGKESGWQCLWKGEGAMRGSSEAEEARGEWRRGAVQQRG